MTTITPQFPLVDALLLTPQEGVDGMIGICTNTSAPGQVFNEIEEKNRNAVSVLGPLIVSRDGTERMILNSLSHPTLKYLILFSEESLTFSPSTNLLLALKDGLDTEKEGNYIRNGKAASAHFPNLSKEVVDSFRDSVVVLPLFMYQSNFSDVVVKDYLDWIAPQIPPHIHTFLTEVNSKKKIYYDVLNTLITMLQELPYTEKEAVNLNPKDFQHLQPPKIELENKITQYDVPFRVSREKNQLRVDIEVDAATYTIVGDNDFLIEYSLMKFLGERKNLFSSLHQMLLGAELNRINTEILNNISSPSFVKENNISGSEKIPLESNISLVPDHEYYYKVGVKDETVSVMCMAFDVCEEVFELQSKSFSSIIEWLSEKNRFEDYEMDILHRFDIGGQIGRAGIAAQSGYLFMQDFPSIFKINTERLPLLISESDSFLDVHRNLLLKIYTQGLTEEHGDTQKGLARTGIVLAIYRNAPIALKSLPIIYKQGELSPEEMREAYKEQLLRFDHDGSYSYGERTRAFFGFDQLPHTSHVLKENPHKATVIQRYDPSRDMGSFIEEETGKTKFTHDPCLTHDIFFIKDKKLHSFHIARAHNTPNAYPENIFGLYDAYVTTIQNELGIGGGDMYMLSSRANILLLTEEQRVRKIIAEPSKPIGEVDSSSGPYLLGENVKERGENSGVEYIFTPHSKLIDRPCHTALDRIENFEGVNTLEKAITYLKEKGVMHNNPVLTTYQAGKSDSQGDHLVFFQANVFGGKIHSTAVFINHTSVTLKEDKEFLDYIATKHSEDLGFPLGDLTLFYINAS
ncbi:hypothetical protein HQ403_01555 [Candidatus Kaiserbacteria bacterium]|nr:hypothetical protein [Candidatus Kaiserbacteria bacterium]